VAGDPQALAGKLGAPIGKRHLPQGRPDLPGDSQLPGGDLRVGARQQGVGGPDGRRPLAR
jgi:hypothetical protein